MATRLAPATPAAHRGISAATLLLGLLCGSAVAATGVATRCEVSAPELPEAMIVPPALTIDVADLGVPDLADLASQQVPLESALPDALRLVPPGALDKTPLVDTVHASSSDAGSDLPTPPPVAGTKAGTDDLRSTHTVDQQPADLLPAPGVSTKLPGVSETELPRLRRQMYRTDI